MEAADETPYRGGWDMTGAGRGVLNTLVVNIHAGTAAEVILNGVDIAGQIEGFRLDAAFDIVTFTPTYVVDPVSLTAERDISPNGLYTEGRRPRWERDVYNETDDWEITMDHQCDSWEVGSVDDARRFVADLQALIDMGPPGLEADRYRCYAPWLDER